MMTEDFTGLPLGSFASRSRIIIRCPRCRRHGVLESSSDGARRCVHVEVSSLGGTVAEVTDRCEVAGPRFPIPARSLRENLVG
jgi:hypothetical protein